jgi:hypothetical protein
MKLTVGERIRLLTILPEKGNLLTLKIISKLRDDLSFSEKEHKDFNIVASTDRITWNDKARDKDIEVGDQVRDLAKKTLQDLEGREELTLADLGLWEKFVGENNGS